MTTIFTSLLVGAAIGEFAKMLWAHGGKVQAISWSVMALATYVLLMMA